MVRRLDVVMLMSVALIILTACSARENVPKKSEIEMIEEIKEHDLGTYSSDGYDEMFTLGTEGELVLFVSRAEKKFVLADNPKKGNHFYEEVFLEKDLKPLGASGMYIVFEDVAGQKYGIMTVKDPEFVRIGQGIDIGTITATPFSEISEENQNYIPISY